MTFVWSSKYFSSLMEVIHKQMLFSNILPSPLRSSNTRKLFCSFTKNLFLGWPLIDTQNCSFSLSSSLENLTEWLCWCLIMPLHCWFSCLLLTSLPWSCSPLAHCEAVRAGTLHSWLGRFSLEPSPAVSAAPFSSVFMEWRFTPVSPRSLLNCSRSWPAAWHWIRAAHRSASLSDFRGCVPFPLLYPVSTGFASSSCHLISPPLSRPSGPLLFRLCLFTSALLQDDLFPSFC